jgi:hypothetical protein
MHLERSKLLQKPNTETKAEIKMKPPHFGFDPFNHVRFLNCRDGNQV